MLALSFSASAVVIRDDVDDAKYRVPDADPPALAELPMEGQGVLIDSRWVITAAHAVTWQSGGVNEVPMDHVLRHARARSLAIARGDHQPRPNEPMMWFTSMRSLAEVLSGDSRALLRAGNHPRQRECQHHGTQAQSQCVIEAANGESVAVLRVACPMSA